MLPLKPSDENHWEFRSFEHKMSTLPAESCEKCSPFLHCDPVSSPALLDCKQEDPSSGQKLGQEAEYHIQGQTPTGKWKGGPGHLTQPCCWPRSRKPQPALLEGLETHMKGRGYCFHVDLLFSTAPNFPFSHSNGTEKVDPRLGMRGVGVDNLQSVQTILPSLIKHILNLLPRPSSHQS